MREERIRDPKMECMSRDEAAALQSEKLVRVVERVYKDSPFYARKFREIGLEPGDIKGIEDISKIPFTTKEELRENYPFGLLAVPKSQVARLQGTSGTTGKLTIASYTQSDVNMWGECVARCMTMGGLSESDIIHDTVHFLGLKREDRVIEILDREILILLAEIGFREWIQKCLDILDGQYVLKIIDKNQQKHMLPRVFLLIGGREQIVLRVIIDHCLGQNLIVRIALGFRQLLIHKGRDLVHIEINIRYIVGFNKRNIRYTS